MRDVLVIGGNRYFGKRLISRLLNSGDRVTVLNRGSSAPPAGVTALRADRGDEHALRTALGPRGFDVVVDQVCYTPRQADIARRVFAGRTGRYVEYEDSAPVGENAVDPLTLPVDLAAPWDDADFRDGHYGEGKRQAEAVFAAGAGFDWVSVRTAHVLGGADDFTGRLGHYASLMRAGRPVAVPATNHPATYIHVEEIADFLFWAAARDFTGPVNENSHGPLTTADICAAIGPLTGTEAEFTAVEVGETSPFSFARSYGMDNARATALGFAFGHTADWLGRAVAETLGAHGGDGEARR